METLKRWRPLGVVLSLVLSASCAHPSAGAPVAPVVDAHGAERATPSAPKFVEILRREGHRDDQVCKHRRLACRITERVPGFGYPDALGHVQTTSEKPTNADSVIRAARRAAQECLQAAPFANRPVTYRVWVAPDGRVSKLTAAAPMTNSPVRRCGRRLSHRAYPAFPCGYGFEVRFSPIPRQ